MQLSFLGQHYEASFPFVEATVGQDSGAFLGKRYIKKQFNVSQRHPLSVELTYRGVRYNR